MSKYIASSVGGTNLGSCGVTGIGISKQLGLLNLAVFHLLLQHNLMSSFARFNTYKYHFRWIIIWYTS